MDKLQNKIRKMKNPSMVAFCLDRSQIPESYLEAEPQVSMAYLRYAEDLLTALKDIVPAVRFDFATFALLGGSGLEILRKLLEKAKELDYYVLLDVPTAYTPQAAALSAEMLMNTWHFDGLLLNCYFGADMIKPFVDSLKHNDKDLFLALRTGNKSAAQLQDLLAGSRLVHTVAADMAKLLGEDLIARCGYSRIGGVGPATSSESLQLLRNKYPAMFLLVDGGDYSGANGKICSVAFDKLGHGAVLCVGESVIAAWKEMPGDPIALAVEAAERLKKNINRYIAIL